MKKYLMLVGLTLTAILAGCGNDDEIVIGGKPWTEQYILPQIIGQYIEANSTYKVSYKEGLGATGILTPALQDGDIDLYVEYTGTGLMDVLKIADIQGLTSDEAYALVKEGYANDLSITWMPRLGFENAYTLATAEDFDVTTYSELAKVTQAEDFIFGAPHTFYERVNDGYDSLLDKYSFLFKEHKNIDANVMYEALKNGDVDIIPAFTTDSRIEAFNLNVYEDDLNFFPKYDAAPIVNNDSLEQFPELKSLLTNLEGQITNEEMLTMNARVDSGEKPEDVAMEFLQSKGLVE